MAVKKPKTVKELNSDVDDLNEQVKHLKVLLESIRTDVNLKIKNLEEKLSSSIQHLQLEKVKKFKCVHCKKVYGEKSELIKHLNTEHQKFTCNQCNQVCHNINTLDNRIMSSHGISTKHNCEECNKKFISYHRLKN